MLTYDQYAALEKITRNLEIYRYSGHPDFDKKATRINMPSSSILSDFLFALFYGERLNFHIYGFTETINIPYAERHYQ